MLDLKKVSESFSAEKELFFQAVLKKILLMESGHSLVALHVLQTLRCLDPQATGHTLNEIHEEMIKYFCLTSYRRPDIVGAICFMQGCSFTRSSTGKYGSTALGNEFVDWFLDQTTKDATLKVFTIQFECARPKMQKPRLTIVK